MRSLHCNGEGRTNYVRDNRVGIFDDTISRKMTCKMRLCGMIGRCTIMSLTH